MILLLLFLCRGGSKRELTEVRNGYIQSTIQLIKKIATETVNEFLFLFFFAYYSHNATVHDFHMTC